MSLHRVTAVLHAHSTWSYDGSWPLSRLARLFGSLGIEAVMMTEHDTGFDPSRYAEYVAECAAASTGPCRIVPGIEYSSPDNDVHILTWGLDHFLAESRPVLETLRKVHDAGGISVFAHPKRRQAWRHFRNEWLPYLAAIELWNRKSDGLAPGREALGLIQQNRVHATAGMDFHRAKHLWPLTNRIEVDSGLPLETGLVEGLRAGRVSPLAFGVPLLGTGRRETVPLALLNRGAEGARSGLKFILGRSSAT